MSVGLLRGEQDCFDRAPPHRHSSKPHKDCSEVESTIKELELVARFSNGSK